jgi:uncharacterized protein YggE
MKRKFVALAIALLTITAGGTGFGLMKTSGQPQSDAAPQQAGDDDRTVAVTADGQVQAAPDRAVIRVAATARADSIETVRRQLADNASRLRTALRDSGLDADQITSARYDIRRNHRHDDRPSEPEFRGQHSFVVTVNETDRAGEIVVTAVENGATRIENVEFTITQETRRDLRERALSKAVENAHGKAEVAANGTGLELAGVHTVRTADVSTKPVRRTKVEYAAANADGAGTSTSFEGGTVTVTADVVVVYNATGE